MRDLERRCHPRLPTVRPVKLRSDATGLRYLPGRTRNLSAGGALIELDRAAPFQAGQHVHLALAQHPSQPIFYAQDLLDAVVVRSLRHGSTCHLAVRFVQPQPMALAG